MEMKRTDTLGGAVAICLVSLAVAAPVPGLAGEAEKEGGSPAKVERAAPARDKDAAPSRASEKLAGFVGTVIAAVPASKTLVVDVPLGKRTLRVGAAVTGPMNITADGEPVSFDRLKAGARVRIRFRRVATGDEAISMEAL